METILFQETEYTVESLNQFISEKQIELKSLYEQKKDLMYKSQDLMKEIVDGYFINLLPTFKNKFEWDVFRNVINFTIYNSENNKEVFSCSIDFNSIIDFSNGILSDIVKTEFTIPNIHFIGIMSTYNLEVVNLIHFVANFYKFSQTKLIEAYSYVETNGEKLLKSISNVESDIHLAKKTLSEYKKNLEIHEVMSEIKPNVEFKFASNYFQTKSYTTWCVKIEKITDKNIIFNYGRRLPINEFISVLITAKKEQKPITDKYEAIKNAKYLSINKSFFENGTKFFEIKDVEMYGEITFHDTDIILNFDQIHRSEIFVK